MELEEEIWTEDDDFEKLELRLRKLEEMVVSHDGREAEEGYEGEADEGYDADEGQEG